MRARINSLMQFLPYATVFFAMFFNFSLTFAEDIQTDLLSKATTQMEIKFDIPHFMG